MYDKPTANIILIGEKLKSISSKIRNKIRMFSLSTFIQLNIRSLAMAIRQENEIKGIQIGKEEVKLSLFTDDMILYIEIPKGTTRKLLELINEVGNTSGYKRIYINLLHFYALTTNYQKKKLRKHPIYHHIKKNKILGINLP